MEAKILGDRMKALMNIRNIKRDQLAKELGMSYNTLTKKLNGKREFTVNELYRLKEIFKLDNELCAEIFLKEDFLIAKLEKKTS